ncbi:MAG: ankyrin repeat domain-containing protein [Planctomycetes bacterium]|nr:ankyrin repeat domain-containing protein [Planctomycetota bacterium]
MAGINHLNCPSCGSTDIAALAGGALRCRHCANSWTYNAPQQQPQPVHVHVHAPSGPPPRYQQPVYVQPKKKTSGCILVLVVLVFGVVALFVVTNLGSRQYFEQAEQRRREDAKRQEERGAAATEKTKATPDGISLESNSANQFLKLLEDKKYDDAKSLVEATPSLVTTRTVRREKPFCEGNDTALHCAARYGTPEIVQLLIGKGAELEATDAAHLTPLWRCIWLNWTEYVVANVRVLLKAGAKVNAEAREGGPSLSTAHLVVVNVKLTSTPALAVEVLNLLQAAGLKIDARDMWGAHTALHVAARGGNTEIVRWLVEHGADINAPGKSSANDKDVQADITPLHLARTKLAEVKADKNAARFADKIARLEAIIEFLRESGGK